MVLAALIPLLIPVLGFLGVVAFLLLAQGWVTSIIIFAALILGAITLFWVGGDNLSLNTPAGLISIFLGLGLAAIAIFVLDPSFYNQFGTQAIIETIAPQAATSAIPNIFSAGAFATVPVESTAIGALNPIVYWVLMIGLGFATLYALSKTFKFKIPVIGKLR